MGKLSVFRKLGLACVVMVTAGCATSPLYSDGGRNQWTVGEIPRDARGEPVWAAIPPVPGQQAGQQQVAFNRTSGAVAGAVQPAAPGAVAEGDAEEFPKPRTR